jgi:hypothetical protein
MGAIRYNGSVMKIKRKPTLGRCGRIAVLLTLSLLMTLNTSQAMTLCVRGSGDMVLELLVQGHCTCEMGTPGADSSGALAGVTPGGTGDGGWPCLDIPVPTSSCDSRVSVAADAHPPCLAGAGSPESAMTDPPCAVVRSLRVFRPPHMPLETILLQV